MPRTILSGCGRGSSSGSFRGSLRYRTLVGALITASVVSSVVGESVITALAFLGQNKSGISSEHLRRRSKATNIGSSSVCRLDGLSHCLRSIPQHGMAREKVVQTFVYKNSCKGYTIAKNKRLIGCWFNWLSKCLNECRLGELTRVSLSEFQALTLLGTNE